MIFRKHPRVIFVAASVFLKLTAAALAHSPLETSTRAIAHENTIELVLTVGMDAGARLLQGQPRDAFQNRPVGPGFVLSKDFAARLFELSAGEGLLSANKTEVRT